ncbi:MAG: hypothetical protein ACOYU0_01500 [Nitrospirota bacterium]
MPLLKGFSKVDERGRLFIPSNIREKAGISAGSLVEIKVIRIKSSSRWPHIIVHTPGVYPHLSMLQVVMMEERSQIDDEARLILPDSIIEETKLGPNYRVEIKLAGPHRDCWIVIYNRGPARLTTLQEKIGRLGKDEKKWKPMTIEY